VPSDPETEAADGEQPKDPMALPVAR